MEIGARRRGGRCPSWPATTGAIRSAAIADGLSERWAVAVGGASPVAIGGATLCAVAGERLLARR
ncbi:MAG TPA: hypothetical protein VK507_08720 [Iamia sp.]|nr:hypothetical protein [Iamia sp.]